MDAGCVSKTNRDASATTRCFEAWDYSEPWSLTADDRSSLSRVLFMGDVSSTCGLDQLLDVAHRYDVAVDVLGHADPLTDAHRVLTRLNLAKSTGGDIYHGVGSMAENLRLVRHAEAVFVANSEWFDRARLFVTGRQPALYMLNQSRVGDETRVVACQYDHLGVQVDSQTLTQCMAKVGRTSRRF